jgi:hypothetical protein
MAVLVISFGDHGDGRLCENHFAFFHPPTYNQISVVFRNKGHQLSCYFSYVSFMAAELVIWRVVTQSDGSLDLSDIYSHFQPPASHFSFPASIPTSHSPTTNDQ